MEKNTQVPNQFHQEIILITTGGTIDKSYDEFTGALQNRSSSVRDKILSKLRLPYTQFKHIELFSKDSLHMTDYDRELLAKTIEEQAKKDKPILVIHGTDTMVKSASFCQKRMPSPNVAIVFTGAMAPLSLEDSDAKQNVTEALLACKLLAPGHYLSFHNHIFTIPHVRKNREHGTFEFDPN